MSETTTQSQQERRTDAVVLALGERIGQDWQQHVQDSLNVKAFEWASCAGCGLRVKHEGYCHKCG